MELQHFTHHHPLFFIQHHSVSCQEEDNCFGCGKLIDGPSYGCNDSKYYLHKRCGELELTPHLNHPFHPQHLLTLLPKSPYKGRWKWMCGFCGRESTGFAYYCLHYKAIWDGKSTPEDYDERSMEALDESINWITDVVEEMSFGENTVAVEIKHAYHDHNLRLTFSGEMNDDGQCDGCMRPISTPFYSCEQCKFFLHKECTELWRKKRHPFHKNLLTLTNSYTMLSSRCCACRRLHHGFSYKCNDKRLQI